jgi:hypothetical protein
MIRRFWFFLFNYLFFFSFFLSLGFSISMDVNVVEAVEIVEVSGDQFYVVVSGTYSFFNPSYTDSIYEYGLSFDQDFVLDNKFDNVRLDFYNNNILGRDIAPRGGDSYNFTFNGFLPKKYIDVFLEADVSFFEWYVQDIYFSPLKIASIHKFNREHTGENVSRRQIVVSGRNPTTFDVKIEQIRLSKTDSTGYYDFKDDDNLLNIFTLNYLAPFGVFNFSTHDELSDDTSVYWIDYTINTINDVTSDFDIDISYLDYESFNDDLAEGEVRSDYSSAPENVYFRKSFDSRNVVIGSSFFIYLNIINANNFTLKNLNLYDKIPMDLRLFDQNGDILTDFEVDILEIKPFETKMFEYELKFYDMSRELFFLHPAILKFKGETVYSNTLTLVNDLNLYDEKVLIEKEITRYYSGGANINIRLENVGNLDLYDLNIIEILSNKSNYSNEVFIESNYLPKSWIIPKLLVGDVWETSYSVNSDSSLNFVPEVYGIESSKVFKSIIINNEVKTSPIDSKTSKVIRALAILGFIIFFIDIMIS